MSATVDTNMLLYAVNRSADEHDAARRLVERLGAGPEIMYLFWPVLMGFLRIATHPAILPEPMSAAEARAVVDSLLSPPHVRASGEEAGFWELYTEGTETPPAAGNEVPDAHLATLMRQHGVRVLYTRDRGFRRFRGIDVIDPLEGANGDVTERTE